jgi:hypothetical protein
VLFCRFFANVSSFQLTRARTNANKRNPSPRSIELITKLSALDIEFYKNAVALLDARMSAAFKSPARADLARVQMQGRRISNVPRL